MTDREIMQQALDALKQTFQFQQTRDVIAALEAALAQSEFDTPESHIVKWSIPVDPNNFGEPLAQPEQAEWRKGFNEGYETAIEQAEFKALKEAEEQEPVAWMQDSLELYVKDHPTPTYTIPLYTAPPKREWVCKNCGEQNVD
jgi:hypothetical protein